MSRVRSQKTPKPMQLIYLCSFSRERAESCARSVNRLTLIAIFATNPRKKGSDEKSAGNSGSCTNEVEAHTINNNKANNLNGMKLNWYPQKPLLRASISKSVST